MHAKSFLYVGLYCVYRALLHIFGSLCTLFRGSVQGVTDARQECCVRSYPAHVCRISHFENLLVRHVLAYVAGCCRVLQSIAGCRRVLPYVAGCCRVLQGVSASLLYLLLRESVCMSSCVAVRCSVLQCVAVHCAVLRGVARCCRVLQGVVGCCSKLAVPATSRIYWYAIMCCRMLQGIAECYRVLQSVAGHCSVLQGVAGCCRVLQQVGCIYYIENLLAYYVLPYVAECCRVLRGCRVLQGVAGCCRVLRADLLNQLLRTCIGIYHLLPYVAECGRVLEVVAGCCRLLQGVAV